jgi:hypothetical protein
MLEHRGKSYGQWSSSFITRTKDALNILLNAWREDSTERG